MLNNKIKKQIKLEMADLDKNKAISKKYMGSLEDRVRKDNQELSQNYDPSDVFPIISRLKRIENGYKDVLADLAVATIKEMFPGLKNVKIIAKIGPARLEGGEKSNQKISAKYPNPMDDTFRNRMDKRKISNAVGQGEAYNIYGIEHMLDTELTAIDDELPNLYTRLIKSNRPFYYALTKKQFGDYLKMMMRGAGGAGGDTFGGSVQVYFEDNGTPVIEAQAIIFIVLLHELVKGAYELINLYGLKDLNQKELDQLYDATDTYEDEYEDLKYGPFIAADIRDFVAKNKAVKRYPDIKTILWMEMMQLPDAEFLSLIEGILHDSPTARKAVDEMIDEIVRDLKNDDMEENL